MEGEEGDKTVKKDSKLEQELRLVESKKRKSRAKSTFTRYINQLYDVMDTDEPDDIDLIKEKLNKVENAMDQAIVCINDVSDVYGIMEVEEMTNVMLEVDEIDRQYDDVIALYRKKLKQLRGQEDSASQIDDSHSVDKHDKIDAVKPNVSSDMYKQLQRVSIPKFTGIKKQYEFWKSAFMACVDSTNASKQYKFLQLRQYLGGEALQLIDGLGHSEASYEAAKERLERKYGGSRRQMARFMEELENFYKIKEETPKQIQKLAELVDVLAINLKEHDRNGDLGNGVLYMSIQKKMTENMITRFHRWLFESENGNKNESVETLRNWLNQEAEYAAVAQELTLGLDGQKPKQKQFSRHVYFTNPTSQSNPCKICGNSHGVWNCERFKAMNEKERWEKAKENKLCFRCLSDKHIGKNCKRTKKCGINGCNKTHNRMLHVKGNEQLAGLNHKAEEFVPNNYHSQTFTCSERSKPNYIALRTIPVYVKANGREIKVNALLDDGSTRTYINEDIIDKLGIKAKYDNVKVNTLNGQTVDLRTMCVKLDISSIDRNTVIPIEAHTTNHVTGTLKPIDWNIESNKWSHLKSIQFPSLGKRGKVDLLIGLDYSELHRSLGELSGPTGSPTARLTPLGWTCVGPIDTDEHAYCQTDSNMFTFFIDNENDVNETLKRFWEIETVSPNNVKDQVSIKDSVIMTNVKNGMTYNEQSCKYEVPIPWKDNKDELRPNYDQAKSRLESIERKFKREPKLIEAYNDIIANYENKGYVTKLQDYNLEEGWYMPHFPVIKPSRETTKIRLVFDAAAKYKGLSLNDTINQGPKLQNGLFEILLRFRKDSIALVSDIQEMYLQVGLIPPDKPYHRFLWRSDPGRDPDIYQFNCLVFGINASPFLAQYVSQENARLHEKQYPLAAESIIKSTYMDDTMDSVQTIEKGVQLYKELCMLWGSAGMRPRKWLSNSPEVLSVIPQSERAYEVDLQDQLPSMKTLGLIWNSEKDEFRYKGKEVDLGMKLTKRSVLKVIAALFDPLGFLIPYTVRAKIIMQKIWLTGVDWDDELPESLSVEIKQWFQELNHLDKIAIPRCLEVKPDSKIHTFVDASNEAYGAVVYCVSNEQESKIVTAKGRVAPLKSLSIPRLELMAATLGMMLTISICIALNLDIKKCTFWADSMNVLYWIHSQSRTFKSFVANRVGMIHEYTNPNQWRYVPTKHNPADLATRGMNLEKLVNNELWNKGPQFLRNKQDTWPENRMEMKEEAKIEMRRKSQQNSYNTVDLPDTDFRLSPSRFSNWERLVRISAWVHRFIDNCQITIGERRLQAELSVEEIEHAEMKIIQNTQVERFSDEYRALSKGNMVSKNSKIASLNPHLDSDGIIRSDSRLKYAEFIPYNIRFPILLPRKHCVTRLIVKDCHEKTHHGGTNQTLAEVNYKFWIVAAREEIRDYERECAKCRINKAKSGQQIMAPLPPERLGESLKPFTNTAVDFAGPFITKQGRGKVRTKRYLCVFTCMTVRAVHLEIAYSLDTNSFLNALNRFINRRGQPKTIVSDNGKNFVGAVRELRSLYNSLDRDAITKHAAAQRIKWKFIPPNAPHFGGVHESMVKASKKAMYAILGNADLTDEELITAVSGAESLINSRPLTYQTANPDDFMPLTPNHFLIGQLGGQLAPEITDKTLTITKRWRLVQQLIRHFWKRWHKEYLPLLTSRSKWFRAEKDMQVDDVVLVIDPEIPKGQWSLGRIVQVYKGRDGHVRVADVKTGSSVFKRPITRLCLIQRCQNEQ